MLSPKRSCPRIARACRRSHAGGRALSPGWGQTDTTVALVERLASRAGTDYEGGKQTIMDALGRIRLGRSSILAEVADLVAFLISPRAAAISGTEYLIDGGSIPTT
jgi:NAD(P)-dependent dehydrogenase (short-subunit alcohol dehydrogenase family)